MIKDPIAIITLCVLLLNVYKHIWFHNTDWETLKYVDAELQKSEPIHAHVAFFPCK
jgi:hypothetical protein